MKIVKLNAAELNRWRNALEREPMCREFVARYGDVQVRTSDGRILRTLRRPDIHPVPAPPPKPRVRARPQALVAIKGKEPVTVDREPRTALGPSADPARIQLERPDPRAQAGAERSPAPPVDKCHCRGWKRPQGASEAQHHPLCAHFIAEKQGELVELETGVVLREATPDEIAQSEARMIRDGIGTIIVEGRACYARRIEPEYHGPKQSDSPERAHEAENYESPAP